MDLHAGRAHLRGLGAAVRGVGTFHRVFHFLHDYHIFDGDCPCGVCVLVWLFFCLLADGFPYNLPRCDNSARATIALSKICVKDMSILFRETLRPSLLSRRARRQFYKKGQSFWHFF